jgi:hypothetical protein
MVTYTWDATFGQYRDEAGKLVSFGFVRRNIERTLAVTESEIARITRSLVRGEISLVDWQLRMRDTIKALHTLSGAVGRGGRAQMTPAEWGRVGAATRKEYAFLNRLARQIEQGQVKLDESLIRRARSYTIPARGLYTNNEKRTQGELGRLVLRVLHARESCPDCEALNARGYIPEQEQPALGTQQCRQYDRCTFAYRRAEAS